MFYFQVLLETLKMQSLSLNDFFKTPGFLNANFVAGNLTQ